MAQLKGLATGIGSLPHTQASGALELVFKYCPRAPFWPQLPKRDVKEGMIAQFSQNLPCLRLTPRGVVFDPADRQGQLEKFYERIIAEDTDYFKISPDYSAGFPAFCRRLEDTGAKGVEFLKCHVTGPFTFAASLKNEKDASLLHDTIFFQALLKALAMKALWQIKSLKKFGKKIIVFIDEPYLGCFGSAYTPINRGDVLAALAELTGAIKSEGVFTGVHCCGNTDWSIFTDTPGIDIINFDAFGFLERVLLYADSLKGYFARGGALCWGIVPTQEFDSRQAAAALLEKIQSGIGALVKKGIPRQAVLDKMMISPACGLGALDTIKAEAIFKLLSETSALIGKTL